MEFLKLPPVTEDIKSVASILLLSINYELRGLCALLRTLQFDDKITNSQFYEFENYLDDIKVLNNITKLYIYTIQMWPPRIKLLNQIIQSPCTL